MQTRRDAELLERFHLMDQEEQEFFLDMAFVQTEGRTTRRGHLKVIQGRDELASERIA